MTEEEHQAYSEGEHGAEGGHGEGEHGEGEHAEHHHDTTKQDVTLFLFLSIFFGQLFK